jgi:glycosyltransferase involved in cell wall biosynthesis
MENLHEKILVSILLPVKNASKYLEESLCSLLNQSHRNIEIIIVYDNSIDDSLEIIEEFKTKDDRIKLVKGNNKGLAAALNLGMTYTNGKYLARMDSDDISLADRIEKQVRLMEETGADICGCDVSIIDNESNVKREWIVPKSHYDFVIELASHVPFAHGSVLIRLKFLSEAKLKYREIAASEDYQLWVDMFIHGARMKNLSGVKYQYRQREDSVSNMFFEKMLTQSMEVRKTFLNIYCDDIKNAITWVINDNYKSTVLSARKVGKAIVWLLVICKQWSLFKLTFKISLIEFFIAVISVLADSPKVGVRLRNILKFPL